MGGGLMMAGHVHPSEIAAVIVRFPADAEKVRRLAADSEEFREVCEHLALARRTLAAFEERADAQIRPEILDYRRVIAELEREIARLIDAANSGGRRA
jgi:hypothetical protein